MNAFQCMRRTFLAWLLIVCFGFPLKMLGQHGDPAWQQSHLSLAGRWQFALDPEDKGLAEAWFDGRALPHTIHLPGTTDQAQYGTKTVGAIPMILTRRYRYYGAAWYRRDVIVPRTWKGDRQSLYLERVIFQSTVWVDGKQCDSQDSLVAPHVHALGQLSPGHHVIVIRIDNRPAESIGVDGHGYSEFTQTIWNGAIGRIELQSHPQDSVQQVRVFGDVEHHTARVEIKIATESQEMQSGDLHIVLRNRANKKLLAKSNQAVSYSSQENAVILNMPLTHTPQGWSEYTPVLYDAVVQLKTLHGVDQATASFGFRNLKTTQHHVYLNGHSIFIRGSMDHSIYPLTGYPPTSVAAWKKVFRIYKAYGMNAVRFHSWTPPEEAFQAADEVGIYIQTEICWFQYPLGSGLPFGKTPTRGRGDLPASFASMDGSPDHFVQTELRRITDTYGNHPSFVFLVIGNELGKALWNVTGEWVKKEKEYDPRHLYAVSTARTITPYDDFNDTHQIPHGGRVVGKIEADNDWDYESAYRTAPVPIIAHELGQWPTYPRWSELHAYTGVLQPRNLERYREEAKRAGVFGQDERFHVASNALSLHLYKDEMESQLRTPDALGYSTLDMQDYPGQGEALVGWLDAFYRPKANVKPEMVRRWNNDVVALARLPSYVWTTNQTINGSAEVANHSFETLQALRAEWHLIDGKGHVVQRGQFQNTLLRAGEITSLGKFSIPLANIVHAGQYRFEVDVETANRSIKNGWDLWVYPAHEQDTKDIVVTTSREIALADFFKGQSVLLDAHTLGDKTNSRIATFKPTFWSAEYFQGALTLGAVIHHQSAAFANFPTEDHYNWQWQDLCDHGRGFSLDALPHDFLPIVQPIPDFHANHRYGTIFELRSNTGGRLLVSGYDITTNLQARPAALQLRTSLIQYVSGTSFHPREVVTPQQLDNILPAEEKQTQSASVLEIKAGNPSTADELTPWQSALDTVVHQDKAFSYLVTGADISRLHGIAGWSGMNMRLQIGVKEPDLYMLVLHLQSPQSKPITGLVAFSGQKVPLKMDAFGAQTIELTVMREDCLGGHLIVTLQSSEKVQVTGFSLMRR